MSFTSHDIFVYQLGEDWSILDVANHLGAFS